jgi:poly-D-alanine transfer protein DltD
MNRDVFLLNLLNVLTPMYGKDTGATELYQKVIEELSQYFSSTEEDEEQEEIPEELRDKFKELEKLADEVAESISKATQKNTEDIFKILYEYPLNRK